MKDPAVSYLGHIPYENYREYLDYMLAYMDVLLLSYLQNNREEYIGITDETISGWKVMLKSKLRKNGLKEEQDPDRWKKNLAERLEFIEGEEIYYPSEYVLKELDADDFVRCSLMLTLKIHLDSEYAGIISGLCGGKTSGATLEFCRKLLLQDAYPEAIDSYLAVHRDIDILQFLYPSLDLTGDFFSQEMICDRRLADIILGTGCYFPAGAWITKNDDELAPLFFMDEPKQLIQSFMNNASPIILITGDKGSGKKHLLKHVSADMHERFVFYDCKNISERPDTDRCIEIIRYLRFIKRECVLYHYAMVIYGLESLPEADLQRFISMIDKELKADVKHLFLLSEREEKVGITESVYHIKLGTMTDQNRIEVWKYYLKDCSIDENFNYTAIANTFILTPGQIKGAIRQAGLGIGEKDRIEEKELYRCCYAQIEHKLSEKTTRVKSNFTWDDLKMDADDKEIMRDMCNCVKNRNIVLDKWNFSRVIPYGAGITVLFSGPPGTGKTMAAQVIANELNMELYKIDLSQIIDKYVGETEKNIRLIFEQAKKSSSILFFDEADAIFNKRMEATGSNERFANIESSLLLQCIEEYSGITILATNNANFIDPAFIRRFKYYILFKEPDKEVRYEIWKSVIPKEAPLGDDVDLRELADTFEFTGAVIKNVVISAAYLAAEKKQPISMMDILKSTKREMVKNNLVLTKEKMGYLGELYPMISCGGAIK